MKPALPPSYVNTPVAIAYADVDRALSVTMTRLLGPCWAFDYERSLPSTLEQLAEFTVRPRSTLYRHLKQLCEMQWIRIDQVGRGIIIRPIIARNADPAEKEETCMAEATSEPALDEALLQALAEIGVENS